MDLWALIREGCYSLPEPDYRLIGSLTYCCPLPLWSLYHLLSSYLHLLAFYHPGLTTIMASNHASGSGSTRSRPASVASDILLDPSAPVVMTNEIRVSVKPRRMLNQYEFLHKVGRGQHGEVFLARDSRNNMQVVSSRVLCFYPFVSSLQYLCGRDTLCRLSRLSSARTIELIECLNYEGGTFRVPLIFL